MQGSIRCHRNHKKERSSSEMKHMKHMKMKYNNFLNDPCSMSDDDEYSIHQEFSSSGTALDELQVRQFFWFFFNIRRRGNPFVNSSIRNIVTCFEGDSKLSAFLLKVNKVDATAYNNFRTSRLFEKSTKPFDVIPKIRSFLKNIVSSKRN